MDDARKENPTEPFVGVEEAAAHVGLAVGTVYHRVSTDGIPYWKLRAYHLRFRLSELDRWMAGELEGGFRGHVPAEAIHA